MEWNAFHGWKAFSFVAPPHSLARSLFFFFCFFLSTPLSVSVSLKKKMKTTTRNLKPQSRHVMSCFVHSLKKNTNTCYFV